MKALEHVVCQSQKGRDLNVADCSYKHRFVQTVAKSVYFVTVIVEALLMIPPNPERTVGRPPKDLALKLRDQYWVWHLNNLLPNETFASLERRLAPHLRITWRGKEEGYSQPFAYSKVARGVRGLSASLEEVPEIVHRANEMAPGVLSAYTSILWVALTKPGCRSGSIAPEVRSRLFDHHFSIPPESADDVGLLNASGILRVSRLWHRDALGLLLCHCPSVIGTSVLSLKAEAYVQHMLHWCASGDPAMNMIRDALNPLIASRYLIPRGLMETLDHKVFPVKRRSTPLVGLRMLLRS